MSNLYVLIAGLAVCAYCSSIPSALYHRLTFPPAVMSSSHLRS